MQNLDQDKSSMDMTLIEFKYLTNTCWNEKCQPLTIDMSKDNYTGRNRLGINGIIIPDTSLFKLTKCVFILM